MCKYTGAASSDYSCSSVVVSKQTDGCHDSGIVLTQPVERVTCSDMTSPATDAEGKYLFHPRSAVFRPERLRFQTFCDGDKICYPNWWWWLHLSCNNTCSDNYRKFTVRDLV